MGGGSVSTAGEKGDKGEQGEAGPQGEKGESGKDGKSGVDGKNGKDGRDGIDGVNGVNGTDGANGNDGIDGRDGADGREIELQKGALYIQWRYKGDADWQNLIAYTDLKGEKGDKGATGEQGPVGPANVLSIGTVSVGAPAALLTNSPTGQVLNLTLPSSPAGGSAGQVLMKNSDNDYDLKWADSDCNEVVLMGVGRPDKSETTQGKIDGSELPGTRYISTDGAGVGAWVWTKFGDGNVGSATGWIVSAGDTGNVVLQPANIAADPAGEPNVDGYTGGAKIVIRRVNNLVHFSLGFGTKYGTYKIADNATVMSNERIPLLDSTNPLPQGFGTNLAQFGMMTKDGKMVMSNGMLNILRRGDTGAVQIQAWGETETEASAAATSLRGKNLLRSPQLQWVTNEPWPTAEDLVWTANPNP